MSAPVVRRAEALAALKLVTNNRLRRLANLQFVSVTWLRRYLAHAAYFCPGRFLVLCQQYELISRQALVEFGVEPQAGDLFGIREVSRG